LFLVDDVRRKHEARQVRRRRRPVQWFRLNSQQSRLCFAVEDVLIQSAGIGLDTLNGNDDNLIVFPLMLTGQCPYIDMTAVLG